jgi:hypothetical protein
MNNPTRAHDHKSTTGSRCDSRKPGFLDRLFGFPAMRISERDVPDAEAIDLHCAIEQIESKVLASERTAERLQRELDGAPRTAPSPPPAGAGQGLALSKGDLVDLSVQTWRLARRIEGIDAEKLPREKKQLADSLRRFQRILETLKIEVVDPTGQTYAEGWVEVEVISWEAPEPGIDSSVHWVKQCVAPIIRRNGEIVARGQVVVTEIAN